jgi:hypothetical protein
MRALVDSERDAVLQRAPGYVDLHVVDASRFQIGSKRPFK